MPRSHSDPASQANTRAGLLFLKFLAVLACGWLFAQCNMPYEERTPTESIATPQSTSATTASEEEWLHNRFKAEGYTDDEAARATRATKKFVELENERRRNR